MMSDRDQAAGLDERRDAPPVGWPDRKQSAGPVLARRSRPGEEGSTVSIGIGAF
jgi:hypothetical protein